jgi:hypothetical protein
MGILKDAADPIQIQKRPGAGRRSFVWRVSAGVSAVLASAATGTSGPRLNEDLGLEGSIDGLASRLALLEDELAIRRLHEAFEICLDSGLYEDVVDLFTADGEVAFNGGVFAGRATGVRRLYVDRLGPSLAGRRMEAPPGLQPSGKRQPAVVKVATDRKSAEASFPCSIQVAAPICPDSQLARMARLHGDGALRWWEGGTYAASYAKDATEGVWQIRRLEYRVVSRARVSRAKPMSVPPFSKVFPEDPAGPDWLLSQAMPSAGGPGCGGHAQGG